MSREDAELFILKARVVAGWVEPQALEDALAARAAALDAEEAELDAPPATSRQRRPHPRRRTVQPEGGECRLNANSDGER